MEEKSQGVLAELATPVWTLARQAIESGDTADALKFLEEIHERSQENSDSITAFNEQALTELASYNEEAVAKVFRDRYSKPVREFVQRGLSVDEELRRCTSHKKIFSSFSIAEDAEKFVVTYDSCGSGGRLRRARAVSVTGKAYPWSWGEAGVSYYCAHCCIHFEILPTELRGYPIRITLFPKRSEDPCVHLFYKKPELIPERYFKRIGLTNKFAAR